MKFALPVVLSLAIAAASAAQAPDAKPPVSAAAPAAPATRAPKPRATPTPAPVLVLEGLVRTVDGKPVDKALVLAQPVMLSMREPALVVARTDAVGKFRLVLKVPGPHRVRIEASGWAASTLKDARPGAPLSVTLRKGAAVEGTVRDGNTGAPLPNATVEARDETGAVYAPWEPGAGTVRAMTNARGQFRIDGIAPGLHTVTAYLRGFNRASRHSVPTGGRVDLYAFPGATITGVVRDVQQAAIAGAVVRAEGEVRGWSPVAQAVMADREGRFEFTGLSPGTVRVVARHPEFVPGWVPGVTLERGAEADVEVVLHRGAVVSGRLVAGEDQPVPGRVGVQETDQRPVPMGLDDALRGEAGADGRFRLLLPPGSHALAAVAPGFTPRRVEVDVGTGGAPVDVGDVMVEPGLVIRGRVRDKAGLAVAEAQIWGAPFGQMRGAGPTEARAEADGSFVLAGLSAGNYRLTVRAPGYGEHNKQVHAGTTNAEFVLDRAGTIAGVVVDEAGAPIESFRVAARPAKEMSPTGPSPRMDNFASSDGRFLLQDVPEGTWVVEASAPDRASGVASNVHVAPGSAVDVGRIRLTAGGTVRGLVVDTAGAPIAGANIVLEGASRDFAGRREAGTDHGGAFEVRGVQTGMVEAVAYHPSYAEGRSTPVEVDSARGPAEVRIVLSQGGRIEGRVIRRDGTGVQTLVTASAAGPGGRRGFSRSPTNTAPDGTFVMDHVPPGRVFVMVMAGSAGMMESSHSREVEVREGETTSVEFVSREILVSGHVTRGGAPAPGLRLHLFSAQGRTRMMMGAPGSISAPPTGPQRLTAVTDESGAFALLTDEPGKHHVNVTTADGKVTFPSRTVEIPDADAYTLDLAFSGVPVAGVVIDRDTEQPVSNAHVSARAREATAGRGAGASMTGSDGRFMLELEPGEYKVSAGSEGYAGETTDLAVGAGGVPDLRLALSRGGFIKGRVVDHTGRGVGGVYVNASSGEGVEMKAGMGQTLPDGSFRIDGLTEGTYVVAAQSDLGAFGMRNGVSVRQEGVTLTLRPGGRVQVHVREPDGRPAGRAYVRVLRVSGSWVGPIMGGPGTTGDGVAEIAAPAGSIEIEARKEKLKGTVVVDVPTGATVPAEITLAPEAPTPVKP